MNAQNLDFVWNSYFVEPDEEYGEWEHAYVMAQTESRCKYKAGIDDVYLGRARIGCSNSHIRIIELSKKWNIFWKVITNIIDEGGLTCVVFKSHLTRAIKNTGDIICNSYPAVPMDEVLKFENDHPYLKNYLEEQKEAEERKRLQEMHDAYRRIGTLAGGKKNIPSFILSLFENALK